MKLFLGILGDQCIIFRDKGSTDPLGASLLKITCCPTSKASSFLFLSKMIAKLTQKDTEYYITNKDQTLTPMQWEQ